jgi:hypothetical protein
MRQLTLDEAQRFVMRATRRMDHETSIAAAERVHGHLARHRYLALRAHFENPGGLNDFELAAITGIPQTSIGKRRLELMRDELIEETGLTRPSPTGSASKVWRITQKGKMFYAKRN